MDEVGLAGLPDLPLVDLGAVDVGLLDQVQIRFRPVGIDPLEDVIEPDHDLKKSSLAHGRAGGKPPLTHLTHRDAIRFNPSTTLRLTPRQAAPYTPETR